MLKKLSLLFCVTTLSVLSHTAIAQDGMTTVKSSHSVGDTADKLTSVLESKGMNVFALSLIHI